jgi:myo-inositol-1(or 4)-monophosphatase
MYTKLLEDAVRAARAGGEVLMRTFGAADLEIRRKGDNDFVTRADRESEAAVVEEIRRFYPHHHVLAEEGGAHGGGSGDYQWLIDPLDGTTNFTQGLKIFSLSVACRRGAELVVGVVYDPVVGDLFTALRGGGACRNGERLSVSPRRHLDGAFLATGYPFRAHAALDIYLGAFREVFLRARAIRRCGSAALDLAYTAAGIYDGFFEFQLSAWDIAAGALLLEEAGGRISDLDGGRGYLEGGNVVAGAPGVQEELRAIVARHAGEATLARLVPAEEAAAPAEPAEVAP